ncbi:MAG: hypothetical protein ACOCNC_12860 [Acetivibrio ethanolgignens]
MCAVYSGLDRKGTGYTVLFLEQAKQRKEVYECLLISTGLNMCIPLLSMGIMDYGFIGGDKELLIKQVICSLLIYMIIAVIDIIKEKKRLL